MPNLPDLTDELLIALNSLLFGLAQLTFFDELYILIKQDKSTSVKVRNKWRPRNYHNITKNDSKTILLLAICFTYSN